jgi:hypothetical protein
VFAYATGDDAVEMAEIGRQIDADAVEAHPVPDADSDGSNLVFPVSAPDPYANPVFAPLSGNTEGRQRCDDPLFQRGNIGTKVATAAFQVEHHIGNALPWTVVGILAPPSGCEDGEAFR